MTDRPEVAALAAAMHAHCGKNVDSGIATQHGVDAHYTLAEERIAALAAAGWRITSAPESPQASTPKMDVPGGNVAAWQDAIDAIDARLAALDE